MHRKRHGDPTPYLTANSPSPGAEIPPLDILFCVCSHHWCLDEIACSSNSYKGDADSLPLFSLGSQRPLTPYGRCDIEEKRSNTVWVKRWVTPDRVQALPAVQFRECWLLAGMLSGYQGSCPLEGAPTQSPIDIFVLLGQGVPSLGTLGCGSLQNIAIVKLSACEIT